MSEGPIDDRELTHLMQGYQSADPAALNELIRRLSPLLARYFRASRFGNDAEDLVQDCWMRIHRARHTYRPTEPLLPWVYAIARYTRLDAYRKRRRLESREVLVPEVPEQMHRTSPETGPDHDALARLIANLPESQRDVIVMLKVAGMSLEEVAKATSSTVGAVKQKAHRAYTTLRRVFEKGGEHAG